MLEELFNLVKGSASDSVINNPHVPNEQNNEVIAGSYQYGSVGVTKYGSGGGLENILPCSNKAAMARV